VPIGAGGASDKQFAAVSLRRWNPASRPMLRQPQEAGRRHSRTAFGLRQKGRRLTPIENKTLGVVLSVFVRVHRRLGCSLCKRVRGTRAGRGPAQGPAPLPYGGSPGTVDFDRHRTLEQLDADYKARGFGLAEHYALNAL